MQGSFFESELYCYLLKYIAFFNSVRVTRETAPEAIDKLQRQKLELGVEIHALQREKDDASKERLKLARKALADVEEKLQPLQAAYENEKKV